MSCWPWGPPHAHDSYQGQSSTLATPSGLVASNSLKYWTVEVEMGFILGKFYFNGVTDEHMK